MGCCSSKHDGSPEEAPRPVEPAQDQAYGNVQLSEMTPGLKCTHRPSNNILADPRPGDTGSTAPEPPTIITDLPPRPISPEGVSPTAAEPPAPQLNPVDYEPRVRDFA